MYTQADIDRWKSQYEEIFQQEIDDLSFIFRAIGRQEYQDLIDADMSFSQIQEEVCRIVVLYPINHDWSLAAGHADTLHSYIMDLSGLAEGQARMLLDASRNRMMFFDHQVDCIIHEAFPEFSMEQIENWPIPKQMKYLARAEYILSELRGVPLQTLESAPEGDPTQVNPQGQPAQNQAGDAKPVPLTKEQVEAMLSEKAGRPISLDQETKMSTKAGSMPELGWFAATDGLTGDHE